MHSKVEGVTLAIAHLMYVIGLTYEPPSVSYTILHETADSSQNGYVLFVCCDVKLGVKCLIVWINLCVLKAMNNVS